MTSKSRARKGKRKPRPMRLYRQGPMVEIVAYTDSSPGGYAVFPGRAISLTGEEGRRLSAWLLQFCEWCDAREGK